jgi:hypothetical protein
MWCEEILILGTRQASWQAFNKGDRPGFGLPLEWKWLPETMIWPVI